MIHTHRSQFFTPVHPYWKPGPLLNSKISTKQSLLDTNKKRNSLATISVASQKSFHCQMSDYQTLTLLDANPYRLPRRTRCSVLTPRSPEFMQISVLVFYSETSLSKSIIMMWRWVNVTGCCSKCGERQQSINLLCLQKLPFKADLRRKFREADVKLNRADLQILELQWDPNVPITETCFY